MSTPSTLCPPSVRTRSYSTPCGLTVLARRIKDDSSSLVSALALDLSKEDGSSVTHFELAQMLIKRILEELSLINYSEDAEDSDKVAGLLMWPSFLSHVHKSISQSCPTSSVKGALEDKIGELVRLLEERKDRFIEKATELGNLKDDTLNHISKRLEDKGNDLTTAWEALPSLKSIEDSGVETLKAFRARRDSALESIDEIKAGWSDMMDSLNASKEVAINKFLDTSEDARLLFSGMTTEMHLLFSALLYTVGTMDPSGSFEGEGENEIESSPLLGELPSLDAIKDYFKAESARLSSILPSPPGYEDATTYALALKEGAQRLLHFHELPIEWQHNPFIVSGYRFVPAEKWGTLIAGGIFGLHNETLNIHTHLFGAFSVGILFLSLYWNDLSFPSFFSLTTMTSERSVTDFIVISFFLVAAAYCFICSSLFHIFSHCSTHTYYYFGANLDYVGISLLISASVISYLHYSFYCAPFLMRTIYIGSMFIFGSVGCALPFLGGGRWFNDAAFKSWRVLFFLGLAGSALAPIFHGSIKYGAVETWEIMKPVFPSILSYLTGLFFYVSNYPERLFPGGFCNYFHSHNLWHVGIIGGVYLHWIALAFIEVFGKEAYSCKVR